MESLSLCKACGCMTKNIRQGHTSIFKCGKCGYFKPAEIPTIYGGGCPEYNEDINDKEKKE